MRLLRFDAIIENTACDRRAGNDSHSGSHPHMAVPKEGKKIYLRSRSTSLPALLLDKQPSHVSWSQCVFIRRALFADCISIPASQRRIDRLLLGLVANFNSSLVWCSYFCLREILSTATDHRATATDPQLLTTSAIDTKWPTLSDQKATKEDSRSTIKQYKYLGSLTSLHGIEIKKTHI